MDQKHVKLIANVGIKYNVKDDSKSTSLHIAVQNGNPKRVKFLIDSGHSIDAQNRFGQTPLMLAIQHNHENIIKILIEAGADIEIDSHVSPSVLETIGKCDKITGKLLKLCLQKIYKDYPNNKEVIADKLIEANWILRNAVKLKDGALTKIILQRGYVRSIDSRSLKCRQTALHHAVRSVDVENVKVLLEYNADVNVSDEHGRTPLFYVYYHGKRQSTRVNDQEYVNDAYPKERLEIFKLLLHRGAELFRGHISHSRIDGAYDIFEYGCEEAVKLLLQTGIELSRAVGTFNDTAIHALARNENPNAIQELRDKMFDWNMRNGHGMTPLMMAVQYGNFHAVEFLLNKGADIDATNHSDLTAICYAFWRDNTLFHSPRTEEQYRKCVQILLERNANVQMEVQCSYFKSILESVSSNNWHSLGELVISHLAFKEMHGTCTITQLIRDRIDSNDRFKSYFESSKRLLEMKFNESMNLFNILTVSDKKFEFYARNEELISKIQDFIRARTDNYYFQIILQKRLSKAFNMISLKKEAGSIICNIMRTSYEQFPLIADNIISYLEQKDMNNLIKTLL